MSGLVTGLQNREGRFDSARYLEGDFNTARFEISFFWLPTMLATNI